MFISFLQVGVSCSMPAAHQTVVSFHNAGALSPQMHEAHPCKETPSKAPTRDATVPATIPTTIKRRRSPNAFILFRSFIIANKLFPPELTHQNDVSRYIAGLWRSGSPTLRSLFFEKADAEKLRVETEGHPEPYRTRRVRTRKPRPSKATNSDAFFYFHESPTTAAAEGSLSPSLPFSFSPDMASPSANQSMFAPTVSVPFGHPSTSVPETPQTIAAIPPTLSSWGHPRDTDQRRTVLSRLQLLICVGNVFALALALRQFRQLRCAAPSRVNSFSQLDKYDSSQTYVNSGILSLMFYDPSYRLNFPSIDAQLIN